MPKTAQLRSGRCGIRTQVAVLAVECAFPIPLLWRLFLTEEMMDRQTDVGQR